MKDQRNMNINREDMDSAVAEGILSAEQARRLWAALASRQHGRPRFDLPHLAYYFGALLVIAAMGWFMSMAWDSLGAGGILVTSLVYMLCFVLTGRTLWRRLEPRVPGGLLITAAVCMVPLTVYALQRMTGFWLDPGAYRGFHIWGEENALLMGACTVIAGLVALKYVRFPFLTAPVTVALWSVSLDLARLFPGRDSFGWHDSLWVSLWFGLAVMLIACAIDRRTREDYAFWLYLFGVFAFWSGLSLMPAHNELRHFFYLLINLGLMGVSVLLQRRVFLVFGALGVCGYVGHLAYRVFHDSVAFPFVLTLIGLVIIYLGIQYQRHKLRIEAAVLELFPDRLKRAMPVNRSGRG